MSFLSACLVRHGVRASRAPGRSGSRSWLANLARASGSRTWLDMVPERPPAGRNGLQAVCSLPGSFVTDCWAACRAAAARAILAWRPAAGPPRAGRGFARSGGSFPSPFHCLPRCGAVPSVTLSSVRRASRSSRIAGLTISYQAGNRPVRQGDGTHAGAPGLSPRCWVRRSVALCPPAVNVRRQRR